KAPAAPEHRRASTSTEDDSIGSTRTLVNGVTVLGDTPPLDCGTRHNGLRCLGASVTLPSLGFDPLDWPISEGSFVRWFRSSDEKWGSRWCIERRQRRSAMEHDNRQPIAQRRGSDSVASRSWSSW